MSRVAQVMSEAVRRADLPGESAVYSRSTPGHDAWPRKRGPWHPARDGCVVRDGKVPRDGELARDALRHSESVSFPIRSWRLLLQRKVVHSGGTPPVVDSASGGLWGPKPLPCAVVLLPPFVKGGLRGVTVRRRTSPGPSLTKEGRNKPHHLFGAGICHG